MDLYYMAESPPCRTVLMLIEHLNLKVNYKNVDLSKQEQLSQSFLKINPFHLVPTLVDGDFTLWESRAIVKYLIDKFAPNNQLYPENVQERAKIDQWLYQEMGIYSLLSSFISPVFIGKKLDKSGEKRFLDSLHLINLHMENRKYLALDNLTIADISFLCSLSLAEACSVDLEKFQNINLWMKRVKSELTYYEKVNSEPMINLTTFMQDAIARAQ